MQTKKYNHYFRPLPAGLTHLDVYHFLRLFNVTDPCLQHAIKKLVAPGQRGGKDAHQDVQEAIDTLERWKEIENSSSDGWIDLTEGQT
jgi:hypothetical protein